jgi:excisionase family DNA binding protein
MDVLISDAAIKAIEEAVLKALERHRGIKPQPVPAGLKSGDAAKYIGISRTKFCNMIKGYDESLAAASFSVGRRRLWPKEALDEWMRRQNAAS